MNTIDFTTITACGECCTGCAKKVNGMCKGCIEANGYVPEWAGSGRCRVHACAREHNVQFCGICEEFPCDRLTTIIHWNPNIVEHLSELAKQYHEKVDFSENVYYGYIIKGDLRGAIDYVKQFPEQADRYNRYMAVFDQEQYIIYEADTWINEILIIYQRYYRDAFYLCIDRENAADRLRARLAEFLEIEDTDVQLCDMEQNQIAEEFENRGLHFLGGRTSGYYGHYVWQTTETKTYEVELPDGTQAYTVKLLDGFLSKSWPDYLSFGEIGTGGWTDGDGIINCIKSSYDFESEDFKVSLLKHEAQHARDLEACKRMSCSDTAAESMSSEELEYRAKLVELIYSSERNLLQQFAREADSSDRNNGHTSASGRIMEGFVRKLHVQFMEIEKLPNEQVQAVARMLFEESTHGHFLS